MKYVLDSSVVLKWVLPEADSAKAIRLRDEYQNGVHHLLAPDLLLPEIANGLASAERQGRIKTGESAILLHDVVRAAPALRPTPPLLLRAMALSIATRRAVYDCVYLALAEAEECELVTADDQFARGLRPSYPFIVSLAALPYPRESIPPYDPCRAGRLTPRRSPLPRPPPSATIAPVPDSHPLRPEAPPCPNPPPSRPSIRTTSRPCPSAPPPTSPAPSSSASATTSCSTSWGGAAWASSSRRTTPNSTATWPSR